MRFKCSDPLLLDLFSPGCFREKLSHTLYRPPFFVDEVVPKKSFSFSAFPLERHDKRTVSLVSPPARKHRTKRCGFEAPLSTPGPMFSPSVPPVFFLRILFSFSFPLDGGMSPFCTSPQIGRPRRRSPGSTAALYVLFLGGSVSPFLLSRLLPTFLYIRMCAPTTVTFSPFFSLKSKSSSVAFAPRVFRSTLGSFSLCLFLYPPFLRNSGSLHVLPPQEFSCPQGAVPSRQEPMLGSFPVTMTFRLSKNHQVPSPVSFSSSKPIPFISPLVFGPPARDPFPSGCLLDALNLNSSVYDSAVPDFPTRLV